MFMGTLGLLGTGILVNTLPFLIKKAKNAFDEVKKRFDQLNSVVNKILGFINAITDPSKNLFNIFNKKDTSKNSELESNVADESVIKKGVNEFEFELPATKRKITFKLLTAGDEKAIDKEIAALQKMGDGKEEICWCRRQSLEYTPSEDFIRWKRAKCS